MFTVMLAVLYLGAFAERMPTVDEHVYFAVYGWSLGEPFRSPAGVFFNPRRGEVYVADSADHQILIFDTKGTPITRIRHYVDGKEPGDSRPGEPKQVAVNSRGDILVVDTLARYLDVLDYRGRSMKRVYPRDLLKLTGDGTGCSAVAVDSADNIYLACGGDESAVLVLDQDLRLIRQIGKRGKGPECFQAITGIWVDASGNIYVTDALNEPCVQVFSPEGKMLLEFGAHETGPDNFSLPSGVVADDLGDIYVVDNLRHWIGVFNPEGKFMNRIGGGFGAEPGDLSYPSGISGDGKKTIFTVEKVGARLQGFELKIIPPKQAGKN